MTEKEYADVPADPWMVCGQDDSRKGIICPLRDTEIPGTLSKDEWNAFVTFSAMARNAEAAMVKHGLGVVRSGYPGQWVALDRYNRFLTDAGWHWHPFAAVLAGAEVLENRGGSSAS